MEIATVQGYNLKGHTRGCARDRWLKNFSKYFPLQSGDVCLTQGWVLHK